MLTILRFSGRRSKDNKPYVWVECECGSQKETLLASVRSGRTRSCGCLLKQNDLTGQIFSSLFVIRRDLVRSSSRRPYWFCICICGTYKSVRSDSLTSGKIVSCGCAKKELNKTRAIKHGLCGTKGYEVDKSQRRRAAKLLRSPSWTDSEKITEFISKCPEGYHVDHEIPLQGDLISGLHVLENLQYLPAKVNLSKSKKFVPYTYTRTGQRTTVPKRDWAQA